MTEDKRANPYPYPTAEEFHAAPGTREQKAARCIAARKFGGIPSRAFLLGENDHSPLMLGLLDLTTLCYRLLDEHAEDPDASDTFVELRDMLEDHGCPDSHDN